MEPKYKTDQIVYRVQIRFWENPEPLSCRVVRDSGSDGLLVHSDEHGHEVYVKHDDAFATEEFARLEIEHRMAEKQALLDAEDVIFLDDIMESALNSKGK